MAQRDRIEGWKRIAAYFDRDESTVKRWEATRNLPVRRLPGVRSSVFAYAADLEDWRSAGGPEQGDAPKAGERGGTAAAAARRRPVLRWWALALALGLGSAAALAVWHPQPSPRAIAIDAGAHELYRRGNFALEQRTAASIRKAMSDFSAASARDPRFAAAYSGLAESWLLIREYGDVTDAVAYPRAEAAARAALAIDPRDTAAHRVLAFSRFWYRQDAPGARAEFARALASAPNDARTHHWFANMLYYSGDRDAALREIERARTLAPGSSAIEVDRIKMLTENDPAAARAALDELLTLEPRNRSALTYLAALDFAQDRMGDYFEVARREAAVRGDASTLNRVARFERAYERAGREGLIATMRREFKAASGAEASSDLRALAMQATWPDH